MRLNRIPALTLTGAMILTLTACGPKEPVVTPPPGDTTPPAVSLPAETVPATAPTESGAATEPPESGAPSGDSKVQAVWDEIARLELPSLMELDAETLASVYGIDSADLSEFVCQLPLMNVQATEFFLAQVKSGKMDTVKAAVEQRQKDLENQWSSYLPEQLDLVKDYRLIVNGDYIFFAVSYDVDAAAEIFDRYTK